MTNELKMECDKDEIPEEFRKELFTVHQQTKSNFDYLDIDVPDLDFRGVSGGGLWRIDLGRYTDGVWAMVGSPALEGCAFYQTKPQGDRRLVRCHGRRSIYQHGLAALRQSQG